MATRRLKKVKPERVITVVVNGQVVGSVPESSTIGQAAQDIAKNHGLRAYSMKLDGKQLKVPDLNRGLKGHKQLELYAKDARGSR